MKKLLIAFTILIFSSSFLTLKAQWWMWGGAGQGSEKSNVYGTHVAADNHGNAFICGMFNRSIAFAPYTLSTSTDESYLVKYDKGGAVQWAYLDKYDQYGPSVATDTLRNVYITGYNYKSIPSFYLMKLDTNGTVIWNKGPKIGNTGYMNVIASDKRGYIYVAGTFGNTLVFNNDTVINASPNAQVFVAKFDLNGNVIWIRQSNALNAGSNIVSVTAVHADKAGNVYVTTNFHNGIKFGSYSLVDTTGIALAKYDMNGNLKWAVAATGFNATGTSVTSDKADNSYLTGTFQDSIIFGTRSLHNTNPQSRVFLAKYDTGGKAIWAEQAKSYSETPELTSDVFNNIYIGCSSNSSFDFGGMILNVSQGSDFIMELDTAGAGRCGSAISIPIGGMGIACDSLGEHFYLAGDSYDSVYAGPDTLIPVHGGSMPFVARWSTCNPILDGVNKVTAPNAAVTLYPNPNNGSFNLSIKNEESGMKCNAEVYDMLGRQVYSSGFLIPNSQFLIDLHGSPAGVYLYRVISESGMLIGSGRFIIE